MYLRSFNDIYPQSITQYFVDFTTNKDIIGKGKNIIALSDNPKGKKTLYITAHYDTTSNTNGILDNGSGVVVAMEIARQLHGIDLPINVEFVFFSAEEAGMQGSAYFVSHLTQEEKDNALGCINLDVVGQKGDNEVALKTFSAQINVLSLLLNNYYGFPLGRSELSDHTSFYMGNLPAIYFADKDVVTKDSSVDPLDELDIEKLKKLTNIISNFIIDFDLDEYNSLLKNSYCKEYTDLPSTNEILGYSLIQVNKVLRDNGAGSNTQYILQNKDGNQVKITEKDIRFLDDNITKELQNFDVYNEHVKYKLSEQEGQTFVQYRDDWLVLYYNELEGQISEEDALELLNNQNKFTNDDTLKSELN